MGFPVGSVIKYPPVNARDTGGWFNPWVGKIPWRRKWQPISVFMPGKSHGQRSLASYGPWGHRESDMTEYNTQYIFAYMLSITFQVSIFNFSS